MSYETASDYPEGMPRIPQIKAVGPEMADDPAAALRAAPPAGTRSPAGLGRLRPATPAQQQLALAICADQPAVCSSAAPPHFSVTALGAGAGGWRLLILVVAITAVLYVPSRALEGVARALRYHWQMLAGLTAFQGLLVLIAFVANPLGILDSLGSSSWAFGAFVALIAAIAAVVGATLVMQENKKQHAVNPALPDAARS